MHDKFNLTGKSALITGGAGLLGREHAAALLECGSNIIIADINGELLKQAEDELKFQFSGANIYAIEMDVTSKESVMQASTKLQDMLRIDILINNAAIDPAVNNNGIAHSLRFEDMELDLWDSHLAVGLTGAFICSQIFGTKMAEDGQGGIILNIASDLAVIAPDQRLYKKEGLSERSQPVKPVTYSVAKTALVGLTRYLSTYWAKQGIRANALSPGGVINNQDELFLARIEQLIPMGRMANKEEYRSIVQFLCSEASSYMTGQNIVMDGGRTVW